MLKNVKLRIINVFYIHYIYFICLYIKILDNLNLFMCLITIKCSKCPAEAPEIFVLKNFKNLPVSIYAPEQSLVSLKRLKSYLRNFIGGRRLISLALMTIHRHLYQSPRQVFKRKRSVPRICFIRKLQELQYLLTVSIFHI